VSGRDKGGYPEAGRKKMFKLEDLVGLRVGLASPEKIKKWSNGEIKRPETINYRTFRPEREGLFCERIFGPCRDWECYCGKYKGIRYKGITCDRCGVEISHSRQRRRIMGHIELISPVSHIWYFKGAPSRMSLILDISVRDLEKVLYFSEYIVTDPGDTSLYKKELLNEEEHIKYREKYGDAFKAEMGAEAIRKLLGEIDTKKLAPQLRQRMKKEESKEKKKRITKRLEVMEAFERSNNKPEWMILSVLPVIPPGLRPMVPLEGERFATSDLNDLYRRVINRNNRLKRLMELSAPEVMLRNEKRMLQEAVDALFDNGRRGQPVVGSGSRPLKSLSNLLKGKQGRFRQNLLGKRVDYSGRSVIVVGPKLKLHQCGLPRRMALELFKPIIMRRLEEKGLAHNIKSAKKIVEQEREEVMEVLEEVIKEYPVFLNRAPTLHRLGIQAFEPVLIEEYAIKIHPLVCTAFNADFDGDQMAVHVPLSLEAKTEAQLLMLSTNNILSPSNGKPITAPTQDIVLGCCYLTKDRRGELGEGKFFGDKDELIRAYEEKYISLHARIKMKIQGELKETTVGRVIFNDILPRGMPYINKALNKKIILSIISKCYKDYGVEKTVELLDNVKKMGFHFATQGGFSLCIESLRIPPQKGEILDQARKEVQEVNHQHRQGIITNRERYNKTIDIWTRATDKVTEAMMEDLKESSGFNPVYLMADSGARGDITQVRQLAGMRGLMGRPIRRITGQVGEIIESPITSNFREGLSVLEYFISTHGARKGLADTALKTADSGYLTRRLVDVAQDIIINEEDCGTVNGVEVFALKKGDEVIEPLSERILGRVTLEKVVNPLTKQVIAKANSEITEELAQKIESAGIGSLRIRTVLTCETKRGVCAKCYGRDLASAKMVELGEAVGVIAAQSIGEPGTQLTLRTFHIGGTASKIVEESQIKLNYPVEILKLTESLITRKENKEKITITGRRGNLKVRRVTPYELPKGTKLTVKDGERIRIGDKLGEIRTGRGKPKAVIAKIAGKAKIGKEGKLLALGEEHFIPIQAGAKLLVSLGEIVPPGNPLAEFDPYNEPILTEFEGEVQFKDIVLGKSMREEKDRSTGIVERVITDYREEKLHPRIIIQGKKGKLATYSLPSGTHLVVKEGAGVKAGNILVKIPRMVTKTIDITGGLPRVIELFEARRPKESAVISGIEGKVEIEESSRGARKIIVRSEGGQEEEHFISSGKHLNVRERDKVFAGEPLTAGPVDPHDILRVKGDRELQEFLVNEIQEVYKLQGVDINDKHIEVIVRQMLKKVEIDDVGDTKFLLGQQVEKFRFREENARTVKEKGKPAHNTPLLLGITKASKQAESFISAASFQETTWALTEAAINGKEDELYGLKENVIIGKLIPAGTGMREYRETEILKENLVSEVASSADS
jgi:DNA-directed RNA polymerase subunit beta'